MYVPVPPHGGLTEPVCRTVPAEEIKDFLARAATLAKVPVSDADLSTVYRLGDGGLSPLTGPMDSATYHRVLDESVLAAQRQALCLDHPHRPAGRRPSWPDGSRPARRRPWSNAAGRIVATLEHERRLSLGQAALPADRLSHRADRPSRRRHGPGGRRRQDAPAGRFDPRAAAAEASAVRQVRAHAARGPRAAGRQGLGPRRRLPDPQPLAPRPRIRPGLRPGDAACGPATTPGPA